VNNRLENKIRKFAEFVNDSVDQKVDSVNQRVDSVDQKLDSVFGIEKKLGNIIKQFIERSKKVDTQLHPEYIDSHAENSKIKINY
jgi:hypothetical protein